MSSSNPSPTAVYRVDGNQVFPTEYSRGPWFDDQQHGASVLGLLTRFLERVPSREPMRFTRIVADMSRPVHMGPCTVTARALRDGRRVQSLEATIEADGKIVSRAVATRIRVDPDVTAEDQLPPIDPIDVAPPLPETEISYSRDRVSFHDCLEIRSKGRPGNLHDETWFHLNHPLVEGEEPTPVVRLAVVADMILSSSWFLGDEWMSINPEVMLQVERPPVGEWICASSVNRPTADGIGMSEGVLFDRQRRVGRSSKSVLNQRR